MLDFPIPKLIITAVTHLHENSEKLDQTKNELITAAQHNLRTPLTALLWQLENMRKNSSDNNVGGKDGLREALRESEASVERLTLVLEDFLSITEVKVGGG